MKLVFLMRTWNAYEVRIYYAIFRNSSTNLSNCNLTNISHNYIAETKFSVSNVHFFSNGQEIKKLLTGALEHWFFCKLCEVYTSLNRCTVCRKSIFFHPICFPCTLSARDTRGVYVCLASVYPVIRDRAARAPFKTVSLRRDLGAASSIVHPLPRPSISYPLFTTLFRV